MEHTHHDEQPFALDSDADFVERGIAAPQGARVRYLSLPLTPRIQQIADALKAHYGPHYVCELYFRDANDADTQRYIYAERLQIGAQLGSPGAIAVLTALSLETAHAPRVQGAA